MGNKYKLNSYGEIEGVEGEKTIKHITDYYNKFNTEVLITQEEKYYNVYLINSAFQQEPLNNLYIQEPIDCGIPSDLQIELWVIEFYLWYKHNKDFSITYEDMC